MPWRVSEVPRRRDGSRPLVAVPGCRSGAPDRAQCRMPGAVGHARRRRRTSSRLRRHCLRTLHDRSGPRCRRRPCADWSAAPFTLFDAGFASAPRWLELRARGRARHCRSAANQPISRQLRRARSRVACWCMAGTSRAAGRVPRAWCSARTIAGRRIAGRLFAGGARSCRRTQCRRVAATLAEPVRFLARAARRGVRRRRPSPARTAARRTSAPCRGNTRGACSLNYTLSVALRACIMEEMRVR